MNTKNQLLLLSVILLVISSALISCHSSQMAALPCPDPVKSKFSRPASHANKTHNNRITARKVTVRKRNNSTAAGSSYYLSTVDRMPAEETGQSLIIENETRHDAPATIDETSKGPSMTTEYSPVLSDVIKNREKVFIDDDKSLKRNLPSALSPAACDTIYLKSGNKIIGKVEEIATFEIRYRRCDNPDGPVIVLRKADVSVVKYQNGASDYFTSTEAPPAPAMYPPAYNPQYDQRKVEPLGLSGFIASLVGLIVFGIPLGLVAVIFGSVSLNKIKREPGRFKGRGFALASMIIGLVDIIAVAILLLVAV